MSKIVYISSPYTKGNQAENVRNSLIAAEELRKCGYLPFVPLLSHFWHFAFPHDYDYWMKMDLEWVEKTDIVLRLPGESFGADKEVARALWLDRSVYCSVRDVIDECNELYYTVTAIMSHCLECNDIMSIDVVNCPDGNYFYVCSSCGEICQVVL